ncbi:precorrin-6Y C5,15-methyltransferase (decarboxylating) subunit CbiT [Clostridium sp. D2Q-11]|uniref:Precorrin-6Y C5,15-methyltransferase (Decarboxylating) subunit CbiT n=1 Tax=Anaeromonas frigoriresistens TaxID=2683708 RepID=A0A942UZS7_9FIRM|nr:precorrin-6Y C5,15-methyltransferase (decarboxylating) subunit CbiT [Anaeromonas frigoriresistens]MBS4538572.1 precorrin-6Y C5,15-methyltransferase (decarboxylating) subunit CbiT [Anaeromonas frigoriresistens]
MKSCSFGIPDDNFIRGNIPMTKEEVRAISISKLRLNKEDRVVDVGAGTGAISIEIAAFIPKGKVYSVEKNTEGTDLINKNKKNFNISNIEVIEGLAPEILKSIGSIDKVFIGGSSGKMDEIIMWAKKNLTDKGRIVINAITLENVYKAITYLKKNTFKNIDVVHVNISKGKNIGDLTMMIGQNPIYVISASKE